MIETTYVTHNHEPVTRDGLAEQIREILVQEQDHLVALANALGIETLDPSRSDAA